MSLFFYFSGEGSFVYLLAASIVFNFLLALALENTAVASSRTKNLLLAFGVLGNLTPLIVYKYFGFINDGLKGIGAFPSGHILDHWNFVLPIGISFFTFQALSYLIDVYRGEVRASTNIVSLGLYISLFPQLIAGPIVRYSTINNQIRARTANAKSFTRGILRFIEGLSKKVLLADPIAEIADSLFALPGYQLTSGLAWLAAATYMLQIYFDFSGYSDMAIGLGRMFGFRFLENFRHPYVSTSIREFWRRWHISLSTWFRDYLYIPLGGNRRNALITTRNLFIVFTLCGLWHGASWNFLIWGLVHGGALALERIKRVRDTLSQHPVIGHFYVTIFLLMSWILFRADSFEQSSTFYRRMLFLQAPQAPLFEALDFLNQKTITLLTVSTIISIYPILTVSKAKRTLYNFRCSWVGRTMTSLAYILLFIVSIMQIVSGSYSPFIYFRF